MAVTRPKTRTIEAVKIRGALDQHDKNKIAELWANLAMIQHMHGNEFWLDKQKDSGLNWFPYIAGLVDRADYKFIVMEDPEKIFGFAFLETQLAEKGKLKATIREFYIEPSHKDLPEKELATMIRTCVENMGIKQVIF